MIHNQSEHMKHPTEQGMATVVLVDSVLASEENPQESEKLEWMRLQKKWHQVQ